MFPRIYALLLSFIIPHIAFADDMQPQSWGITLMRCGAFDKKADPMAALAYKEAVLGYWSGLNFATSAMQHRQAVKDISIQHIIYSVHDRCASHEEETLGSAIIDTYLAIAKEQASQ